MTTRIKRSLTLLCAWMALIVSASVFFDVTPRMAAAQVRTIYLRLMGTKDIRYGAGSATTFARRNTTGGVDTLQAISPVPVTAYGVRGTGTHRDADSLAVAIASVAAMGGGDLYFPFPAVSYSLSKTDGSTVAIANANTRAIGFVPPLLVGGAPRDIWGSGSPEGSYVAPVGSVYRSTLSGAGDIYVKKTGGTATGWVLVSGDGTGTGGIIPPVLTNISGYAYCASAITNIGVVATTNERSRFVLQYKRSDVSTWQSVSTSADALAYPELYKIFTASIGCVLSYSWHVRVAAVDSTGNTSAWLDTLTIQLPQDEPVIATNITMGPLTVSNGDLVAHVTGTTTTGPLFFRKLFRKHDTAFADTAGMAWTSPAASTIRDTLNTGFLAPVASDDSTISFLWDAGSGPIAFYRLEYRRPPATAWSVLDSMILANQPEEYWWNLISSTPPRRGPVEMRMCAVDSSGGPSDYTYLQGGTYYNQSELIEAKYYAIKDMLSSFSLITSDSDDAIFYATSPDTTPEAAPQISGFAIVSTDSVSATGYRVRSYLSGEVGGYGTTVSFRHKWGSAATWSDTTNVLMGSTDATKNIAYNYSTGDSTSVAPNTLWVSARATGADSTGAWVMDDIYVERTPPLGGTPFNYLFAVGGGTGSSYGYVGRDLIDVSVDDIYWTVRGDIDSTLVYNLTTTTSGNLTFRPYVTGADLRGERRGIALCFGWPELATQLATATNIDSFRVHVYLYYPGYTDLAFGADDSMAIGFITNTDMQEPTLAGLNNNTTGQYVSLFDLRRWAVSPLDGNGPSRPAGWGPGAWEYVTVPEVTASVHYEFDLSPSIVEAAIASGTWDGTFVVWVAAATSTHRLRPFGPMADVQIYRPSIIVRGSK